MAHSDKNKQAFDIHRTLPPKRPHQESAVPAVETQRPLATKERRFGFKKAVLSFFLLLLTFFLIIGVWDAIVLSRASQKMFGNGNLLSLLGGDLAQHNGRTNILLAGYSADDAGHQGATLTDSIMVLSLDHAAKSGYMLSIPRDLWVDIPGNGYAKINEAYQDGEAAGFSEAGYPAGGMGLLERIVSNNFGLPIDYYALIDYAAFRDTVNAVGGITINIQSNDPRGIYDPSLDYTTATCCALAKYPNGPVKLDGKQALNLARARGDAYGSYGFGQSDFDRTTHQRQMLLALKQKSMGWGVILNPLRAGHIFDGMASNVKTDLGTGNVLPLFSLFNGTKNMQSIGLRDFNGKNYLKSYGGALIPTTGINDYSQIQAALNSLNQ